jgi:hypothetical protein
MHSSAIHPLKIWRNVECFQGRARWYGKHDSHTLWFQHLKDFAAIRPLLQSWTCRLSNAEAIQLEPSWRRVGMGEILVHDPQGPSPPPFMKICLKGCKLVALVWGSDICFETTLTLGVIAITQIERRQTCVYRQKELGPGSIPSRST